MTRIYSYPITFFGQLANLSCDKQCNKAWGINCRPHEQLDPDDVDDIVWLADSELGDAPIDPGTYEAGCAKPKDAKFNQWCARECERSRITDPYETITLPDFSKRIYNMPEKHGIIA